MSQDSQKRQSAETILSEERELTVRVCLRRVFGSRHARCVLRAERDRPACWLAQRVRSLFPAAGASDTVLVSAGYVLPPNEPLAVLAPGDLVEVIPLHKDYGDEDERKFYVNFTSAFIPVLQQNCERTKIQHCDKAAVDPDPYQECDVTQTDLELNSSEDLLPEMKRQALLLLDKYGQPTPSCPIVEAEERNKRRRRRVRRRRALQSPFPVVEAGNKLVQLAVEQNAGAEARAPRCVHAGSSPTTDVDRS